MDAQVHRVRRAGGPGPAGGPPAAAGPGGGRGQAQSFARTRIEFLKSEGVLGLIAAGRGDGGTVFVQGGQGVGSREPNADLGLPSVTIAVEHYGRIARTLEKGMPVAIEMEVRNTFTDDAMSFNVVGEIPGTDKADELVMLVRIRLLARRHGRDGQRGRVRGDDGSHTHSQGERTPAPAHGAHRPVGWRGAGSARIPRIRHRALRQRADMVLKPAHGRFSAYFNVDNGTGAIRGVYLQGNEAVAPVFDAWLKPFNNLGMTTLTIAIPEARTIRRSTRLACPVSCPSRIPSSTARARTIPTWTSTSELTTRI